MRLITSAIIIFVLNLTVAADQRTVQLHGQDFSAEVIDPITSLVIASREGRQVSDLCRFVYTRLRDTLPQDVRNFIAVLVTVPAGIYEFVIDLIAPGFHILVTEFLSCWKQAAAKIFGLDPTAANAILDGAVAGNVFFAQTLEREGEPKSLSVVATFDRLTPSQRYKLSIHKSGDISDDCAFIDSEYSALGGAKFTADDEGKAVLLIQNRDVLLEGTASVLGRSVVVTPVGGGKPTCGVIARNIVAPLSKE